MSKCEGCIHKRGWTCMSSNKCSDGSERITVGQAWDEIQRLRAELSRLRAEVETLVWNLGGISTLACRREVMDYDTKKARPALSDVAKLVQDYARLRAANEELGGHIARMIGELSRADNALRDAGPDFVSGISCAEGIRTLIADRDKQITENKMLRRILARAIAEEACGADSEIYTVATECTEGKCWHAQARAALLRAEQAKQESDKLKEEEK